MNSAWYSDIGPEFWVHLHSIQIQSGKSGWFLLWVYFFGIICPCWFVAYTSHQKAGSHLFPAVRPGPAHAHMAPAVLNHLKANNCEAAPDKLGRRNAQFYANSTRQEMGAYYKPTLVKKFNWLGFSL